MQDAGCRVIWLEAAEWNPFATVSEYVDLIRKRHAELGLTCEVAITSSTGVPLAETGDGSWMSLTEAAEQSDLYLNLA